MAERNAQAVRYRPLVPVLLGLCAGIITDRYSGPGLFWWLLLFVASGIFWLARGRHRAIGTCAVLSLVASFGGSLHHCHWRIIATHHVAYLTSADWQPVAAEVVVLTPPVRRLREPLSWEDRRHARVSSSCHVAVKTLRNRSQWVAACGNTSLSMNGRLANVRVGDRLRIFGSIGPTSSAQNPGEFDFAEFERGFRRFRVIRVDSPLAVKRTSRPPAWHPKWLLARLREQFRESLRTHMEAVPLALAEALLLGIRSSVPAEQTDQFFRTGTIHVFAISGLHIGILTWGLFLAGRTGWLSRRTTLVVIVMIVVGYAFLTGAKPPVIRAVVLVGVFSIARIMGRQACHSNTLAAAGLIVLVAKPPLLLQLGTQLSFVAVAALCHLMLESQREIDDPLARFLARNASISRRSLTRWKSRCAETIRTSSLLWFVTMPLVLYHFHIFTPIALLANPLVCAPLGITLGCGMAVILLAPVSSTLAGFGGRAGSWLLLVILESVEFASSIPGGFFWLPSPPGWWVAVFYFSCIVRYLVLPRHTFQRSFRVWLASWVVFGICLVAAQNRFLGGKEMECHFVSVGHGTCVVMQFPNGENWLYDAGRLGNPEAAVRAISSVLWSCGVHHLDGVIISHADADHYNALPGLLDRFSIRQIYLSPIMLRNTQPGVSAWRKKIEARGVPVRPLAMGESIHFHPTTELQVIHPPSTGVAGSDNANSIVLVVRTAKATLLLTGDLESPGLEHVLHRTPLDCDVLMAPHHGSPHSRPEDVIAWSNPEWVIISSGDRSNNQEVLERYSRDGARVFHTASDGAIRCRLASDGIQVRSFRQRR